MQTPDLAFCPLRLVVRMLHELLCLIAYVVPMRLFFDEFMKEIFDLKFVVEAVGGNRERLAARCDFTEGSSTAQAEATVVLVRRIRFVCRYGFCAREKFKRLALHKHERTGSTLTAARAMTSSHHGWWTSQGELHGPAAATSSQHFSSLRVETRHCMRIQSFLQEA